MRLPIEIASATELSCVEVVGGVILNLLLLGLEDRAMLGSNPSAGQGLAEEWGWVFWHLALSHFFGKQKRKTQSCFYAAVFSESFSVSTTNISSAVL